MTGRKTATIDAKSAVVTLINIFEVEPARQAELTKLCPKQRSKATRASGDYQGGRVDC
jgi:hypothetical protein